MQQKDLKENVEEAVKVAHTICIPIEKMNMDDLVFLVKEAKMSKVEIRLWHETSNFHQGVLVEIQRFHDRTDCSPFRESKSK